MKNKNEMRTLTPIKALRALTGIFKPEQALGILVYVNLLARYLDKDLILEESFLLDEFEKINIKLDLTS